jgi:hypothetical protein
MAWQLHSGQGPRGVTGPVSAELTYEAVLKELRKRSFAVLSTAGENGRPRAVGVEYGLSPKGDAIYSRVSPRRANSSYIRPQPHA